MVTPPATEEELLERARSIAGLTLGELGERCGRLVPDNLLRDKGWQGQLLEAALGTTASTKPKPDFEQLGIELKTIPVDDSGKPKESTFVCTIPLLELGRLTWKTSYAYRKLARVLWIPIQAGANLALNDRCLGMPLLWSPNEQQEACLAQDWQELTDLMSMGQLETITAHHGRYLQVRPKAANGRSLCRAIGPDGSIISTLPRGFYLRARFTEQLLRDHYLLR